MLAIFRPPVHTPVSPGFGPASIPSRPRAPIEPRLQPAQIPVQVLPVLPEIDDGVAHQLAGAVERDVTAALDLEHLDPAPLQLCSWQRQALCPGSPAQRHHRVVLHQQEDVLRRSLPRCAGGRGAAGAPAPRHTRGGRGHAPPAERSQAAPVRPEAASLKGQESRCHCREAQQGRADQRGRRARKPRRRPTSGPPWQTPRPLPGLHGGRSRRWAPAAARQRIRRGRGPASVPPAIR